MSIGTVIDVSGDGWPPASTLPIGVGDPETLCLPDVQAVESLEHFEVALAALRILDVLFQHQPHEPRSVAHEVLMIRTLLSRLAAGRPIEFTVREAFHHASHQPTAGPAG